MDPFSSDIQMHEYIAAIGKGGKEVENAADDTRKKFYQHTHGVHGLSPLIVCLVGLVQVASRLLSPAVCLVCVLRWVARRV